MPSGSHGGSPGSHRSGGSRAGGSFGGGNHSSGSRPSGHIGGGGFRPNLGFWFLLPFLGRDRSENNGSHSNSSGSGRNTGAIILMIIAIVFSSIILGVCTSIFNKNLKAIETDYTYYASMIEYAEENPSFKITGKVTDFWQYGNSGKYYLIYEIDYGRLTPLEGYTYSTFSLEKARLLLNSDSDIEIALNCRNNQITYTTDSIPMICKNFKVTDDAEYLDIRQKRTITISVCSILMAGFTLGLVPTIIKDVKGTKEAKLKEAKREEDEKAAAIKKAAGEMCEYCGAKLSPSDTRCPGCGARVVKKK